MKDKSEIQLRLLELQTLAIETFGSKSKADQWLNSHHIILGTTPMTFAQSNSGPEEIKKILNAISYGGVV
jgi:uncharacterized protein (DUF2384 family)